MVKARSWNSLVIGKFNQLAIPIFIKDFNMFDFIKIYVI